MKYVLILLFFFPISVFANKIDSLQTDSDVYKFLVNLDSHYNGFIVDAYSSMYTDADERKVADSLHVKSWQKTDFNNDGQTGLLVCGLYGSRSCVLAVVSKNGKYKLYDITGRVEPIYGYMAIFFPVIKKDKMNTTIFVYYKNGRRITVNDKFPVAGPFKLGCIKLVYKFNAFTEPNDNPTLHSIQNLTFSSGGGMTGGGSNLSIDPSRKVVYSYTGIYGHSGATLSGTLDTSAYNELVTVLDYIDFPNLNGGYYNVTDGVTYYLTITYDNGEIKKISDYPAGENNYGLNVLYDELAKVEANRNLKKIN
jgi:hypothetical protein